MVEAGDKYIVLELVFRGKYVLLLLYYLARVLADFLNQERILIVFVSLDGNAQPILTVNLFNGSLLIEYLSWPLEPCQIIVGSILFGNVSDDEEIDSVINLIRHSKLHAN